MSRILKSVKIHFRNEAEKKCKTMADVCELAHARTVYECKKKNIIVDAKDGADGTRYRVRAQRIFNRHYDAICERTGL